MFDLKKVVPAAIFAGALMAAGSAHAVPVSLSTLIADFGGGDGDFDANNEGDLDNPTSFSFGPITYNGSANPNGIALTADSLGVAQGNQPTANGFVNGFTFNTHSVVDGFGWTAQINEQNPPAGANAGFLDFRVTFLDVTGTGTNNGGTFAFSQADIDAASVISDNILTSDSTGVINFDPINDLPFFQSAGTDRQILALVSGNAFSENPDVFPNYIISASVPLPAPVVLLISALIGLGFLGRRKLRA